jgi:hypothetical protein
VKRVRGDAGFVGICGVLGLALVAVRIAHAKKTALALAHSAHAGVAAGDFKQALRHPVFWSIEAGPSFATGSLAAWSPCMLYFACERSPAA